MKKTLLYDFHKEHGRVYEYAGFEMPLWYKGPIVEHLAVRNAVGLFDISHMGRLLVRSTHSLNLLNRLLTNDASILDLMQGQHAFFCNVSGGVIDDIMIFRLGEEEFLLVTNAVNKEKDLSWLRKNSQEMNVELKDLTDNVPMIAVQGPRAAQTLEQCFGFELASMPRFHCSWFSPGHNRFLISRTGYTGEDGFEIYLFEHQGKEDVLRFWHKILDAGRRFGIEPCGLAARDTLRTEAGYCLYGNELNEETSPIEAGLDYGVRFDERDFVGKAALLKQINEGPKKTRIGLRLVSKGIPRKGMPIRSGNKEVGVVTSGTYSPLLKKGIAIGYVHPDFSALGTELTIDIRGKTSTAKVVKFPFYDKRKYGWKRKITEPTYRIPIGNPTKNKEKTPLGYDRAKN